MMMFQSKEEAELWKSNVFAMMSFARDSQLDVIVASADFLVEAFRARVPEIAKIEQITVRHPMCTGDPCEICGVAAVAPADCSEVTQK